MVNPATKLKTEEEFINEGHTPMMAQFMTIKQQYPDCLLFYRMGDFYEMFFDDAITASEILDITLTKRGKNKGEGIPMCGVPFHSYEPYLARLIKAGFKVAICDQIETPAQAKERGGYKALVKRDVIRVVTSGTLTEDSLLDAKSNNYLASLTFINGDYGLSWLELSTGEFIVQPVKEKNITTALERINPSEILIADIIIENKNLYEQFALVKDKITIQSASMFDSENAKKRLENIFTVGTLDAFGEFSKAEIAAAGALIDYVKRTQKGKIPYLSPPKQLSIGSVMEIDAATSRSLELTKNQNGERKGTLLSTIDCTITGAGARLLCARMSAPLCEINEITKRHDEVEIFANNSLLRNDIREILKEIPDMERAIGRISVERSSPRDLTMIRQALIKAQELINIFEQYDKKLETIAKYKENLSFSPSLTSYMEKLENALIDEPPALARDGNFIKNGYSEKLDRLRSLKSESRQHMANLQAKYIKMTGIDNLKISHNNVLGYFIDVPAKKASSLMVNKGQEQPKNNPFIHRQSLANNVRFTTVELSELERDLSSSNEKSIAIELEFFTQLNNEAINLAKEICFIANIIARIDVSTALANLAVDMNYIRPKIDESLSFNIEEGRHPVVEQSLKKDGNAFVPNDCDLSPSNRLWLLTGPNMAGKSTFLRQNALIAILAQMGSFVPAKSAHIGVIDRLFSRVGASDDLAKGRSTFMVEMVETATILNLSTDRSLVILDEIGRGTATYDGLSIAWACVEHLHEISKCRSLFATHYHELTNLQSELKSLSCHSMQVKEWKGDVIFMHSVAKGTANKSYGIHVAKLAGLPKTVIKRAEQVLNLLNKGNQENSLTKLANDLPLFSSAQTQENQEEAEIIKLINEINPDELSPKEALDKIYEIKQRVKQQ